MNKVKLLSPDTIAKIAAGEVIERPASAIKELIENSIDAGASRIEVRLKDSGRDQIIIRDNGSGIEPDDLNAIFVRHATSKISDISDLEKLGSLGFRGEALYSIGAIADVTVKSRVQSADTAEAWTIHNRGGTLSAKEPCAFDGEGTEITINELFFNTPARRKFLKSSTGELNQVLSVFMPFTLLHPEIEFVLTNSGKELINTAATDSFAQRIENVLKFKEANLIDVQSSPNDAGFSFHLILGNINIQRPRKNHQYLFINDRPVLNSTLRFHFNDVYRLLFPPKTFPFFCAFITINPQDIDANIHPTKSEVKILQESRLVSVLRHCIEHALMTRGDVRTIDDYQQTFTSSLPTKQSYDTPVNSGIPADQIRFSPSQTNPTVSYQAFTPSSSNSSRSKTTFDAFTPSMFEQEEPKTLQSKFSHAQYIGSFLNKYLLWEYGSSLFMVDQHAAQERIMYELFKKQIAEARVEIQPLLTPITLSLSPEEKLLWEDNQDRLFAAGFETTLFDEDTLAIQTHPAMLNNPEPAVRALLAGDALDLKDNDTLARRACKASIVAGDRLDASQAEHQRQQLLDCSDPFTCPHGRPTIIELTDKFLEQKFLRT